jgi:hypothetical protein
VRGLPAAGAFSLAKGRNTSNPSETRSMPSQGGGGSRSRSPPLPRRREEEILPRRGRNESNTLEEEEEEDRGGGGEVPAAGAFSLARGRNASNPSETSPRKSSLPPRSGRVPAPQVPVVVLLY